MRWNLIMNRPQNSFTWKSCSITGGTRWHHSRQADPFFRRLPPKKKEGGGGYQYTYLRERSMSVSILNLIVLLLLQFFISCSNYRCFLNLTTQCNIPCWNTESFDSHLSVHKYQNPDRAETHRLVLQTSLDCCQHSILSTKLTSKAPNDQILPA